MEADTNRRAALGVLGGALAGLAGCTSGLSGRNPGPELVPCEETDPLRVPGSVDDGTVDGFELRLVETPGAVGDRLVVELRNATGAEATTGNRYKYVVQRRAADSWEPVQRVDADGSWTDDLAGPHPPGEGFRWEFTFSKEGLSREHDDNADYRVCEALSPGTYRFVYWGLAGDAAVASAPFTVEGTDGAAAE